MHYYLLLLMLIGCGIVFLKIKEAIKKQLKKRKEYKNEMLCFSCIDKNKISIIDFYLTNLLNLNQLYSRQEILLTRLSGMNIIENIFNISLTTLISFIMLFVGPIINEIIERKSILEVFLLYNTQSNNCSLFFVVGCCVLSLVFILYIRCARINFYNDVDKFNKYKAELKLINILIKEKNKETQLHKEIKNNINDIISYQKNKED